MYPVLKKKNDTDVQNKIMNFKRIFYCNSLFKVIVLCTKSFINVEI